MNKLNHLSKAHRLACAALIAASAVLVTSTSASAQFVGTAGIQFLPNGGFTYTGTGVLGESFTSFAAAGTDGVNQAATAIGSTALTLAINDPANVSNNTSDDYYSSAGSPGTTNLFNNFISHTYNSSTPIDFTLGGLKVGDTYAVAVYAGPNGTYGGQTPVSVTLNGTSIGTANPQGSANPANGFQLGVNYVTADAVADANGDIVIGNSNSSDDLYALTNGIGVSDISAVPEPSTWAMMFAGLGAIVCLQVVRRRKA